MKLNRIFSVAAVVAVMGIAATSCQKSAKDTDNTVTLEEAEAQFASELNDADTTQVLALGNQFMETMKEGKVDDALAMLYTRNEPGVGGAGVRKLTEEEIAPLKTRFEQFPVVSYTIDHYDFSIPSLNDLKYKYVFRPGSATGKLNIMFNPVKLDGVWYLMLKQPDQPAKDAQNALPASAAIAMPDENQEK